MMDNFSRTSTKVSLYEKLRLPAAEFVLVWNHDHLGRIQKAEETN